MSEKKAIVTVRSKQSTTRLNASLSLQNKNHLTKHHCAQKATILIHLEVVCARMLGIVST